MDLQSFFTSFIEPIRQSAPYIYVSGLLFAFNSSLPSFPVSIFNTGAYLSVAAFVDPLIVSNINNTGLLGIDQASCLCSLTISIDGIFLAGGFSDRMVHIWNAWAGVPLSQTLKGHTQPVQALAFSPDEASHIVSGSEDSLLYIWDLAVAPPSFKSLPGHCGPILSISFFKNKIQFVLSSTDGEIIVWVFLDGLYSKHSTHSCNFLHSITPACSDQCLIICLENNQLIATSMPQVDNY
jgi:WD40 repeat protein